MKPEYRCYFLSCLADITFSLERGLIAEGRLQIISQIFTKSLSETHTGIQAISLSAISLLKIQNSVQINSICNCLKHGNDLVKILASRVLTQIDSSNLYNQLDILLDHIDASISPKVSNNMLTILIDIIKNIEEEKKAEAEKNSNKKSGQKSQIKDLPSAEIPKMIQKLIRLLDSISPAVRGRVYIVLALIAGNAKVRSTTVADICSAKVVATVERELRRNVVSSLKTTSSGSGSTRSSSSRSSRAEADDKGVFLTQALSYRKLDA